MDREDQIRFAIRVLPGQTEVHIDQCSKCGSPIYMDLTEKEYGRSATRHSCEHGKVGGREERNNGLH